MSVLGKLSSIQSRLILSVGAVSLFVVLAASAGAQVDPFADLSDEDVAELLEALEQARALEAQEHWAEALELYLRAEAIAPLDPYRYRQAVCLEQLHRYPEALALYVELQDATDEDVARGARMRIPPLEELVLHSPTPVIFDTDPNEVLVLIDGDEAGTSEGGQLEVSLTPGRHRVELQSDGYQTYETTIEVEAGAVNQLEISLEPVLDIGQAPAYDNSPSAVTWLLAGTSVVAFITGTAFGIVSNDREDAQWDPDIEDRAEIDRLGQEAEDFAVAANVCFIGGGVLAVSALVSYFVGDWHTEQRPTDGSSTSISLTPTVSPRVTGGVLSVSF